MAAAGAEIVVGDLPDFHAVSAALRGVTGAYFCYPIAPGLLDAIAIFAQAASEAGVNAVVNMSQISARREANSNAARQHWSGERLLDRTAMQTAHLRPTFFAEWLIWYWNYRGTGTSLGYNGCRTVRYDAPWATTRPIATSVQQKIHRYSAQLKGSAMFTIVDDVDGGFAQV